MKLLLLLITGAFAQTLNAQSDSTFKIIKSGFEKPIKLSTVPSPRPINRLSTIPNLYAPQTLKTPSAAINLYWKPTDVQFLKDPYKPKETLLSALVQTVLPIVQQNNIKK
jgi:hypothetical protein